MKLAWVTDIHLDCVDNLQTALNSLNAGLAGCDGLILSGDISTGSSVTYHLRDLEEVVQKPIYFVLGNHDYYFSDILDVRHRVVETTRYMSFSKYLGAIPYHRLSNSTVIIGSDGWYDAFNGDAIGSDMIMNDWLKIADFKPAIKNSLMGKTINKSIIMQVAREICKASVNHIIKSIKIVADDSEHVIVVTHVPPFAESYTDDKYKNILPQNVIPWYTSKMMGEMLKTAAKTYQQTRFTVLSGHTHSPFEGDILHNLHAKVGKSQYGSPQIAGYINI